MATGPVCQFHELELSRAFGAIKGVAHHNLAQFCHRVDIAEHTVEQVEEPLQVVVGIACRACAKGFEQPFALRRCNLPSCFHSDSP